MATAEEVAVPISSASKVDANEGDTNEKDKKEEDPTSVPIESCLVTKTSLLVDYPDKLGGFEFWRKTLKSARFIVAPMVDQSELAWRLLSRRYNAELCYTPMLHAAVFARDERYRKENLVTVPEDKPLITQFCANDPEKFLAAAKLAEDCSDAIDLNLGCPQMIAKRGHYGAFLQDDWDLLHKMVSTCHKHLKVPITCKMRVFDDVDKTVRYAKMLESAGCQLLTVHGRTREQKGIQTGLADWTKIKAIKDALSIPVYANGNIQYLSDAERCMEETGVEGVMSAEGNLHNPALFSGKLLKAWDLAEEYVDLYEKYPCPFSCIRGHLFKIFHHCLHVHLDLRPILAKVKLLSEFRDIIQMIKDACKEDVEKYEKDPSSFKSKLPHPYWLCQPYVRPKPDDQEHKEWRESNKRPLELPPNIKIPKEQLSKNKIKRMQHNPFKNFEANGRKYEDCKNCGNPKGERCSYELCKKCCRAHSRKLKSDCPGHHLWFNKERRLAYLEERRKENAAKNQTGSVPPEPTQNTESAGSAPQALSGNVGCEANAEISDVEKATPTDNESIVEKVDVGKIENDRASVLAS